MICCRLIGDSQTERWYDSIECFLSEFLVQEPRAQPLQDTSSNLWLMNLDERLPHKGSFWSPPKPAVCAQYQVQCSLWHIERLASSPLDIWPISYLSAKGDLCIHELMGQSCCQHEHSQLIQRHCIIPGGNSNWRQVFHWTACREERECATSGSIKRMSWRSRLCEYFSARQRTCRGTLLW